MAKIHPLVGLYREVTVSDSRCEVSPLRVIKDEGRFIFVMCRTHCHAVFIDGYGDTIVIMAANGAHFGSAELLFLELYFTRHICPLFCGLV